MAMAKSRKSKTKTGMKSKKLFKRSFKKSLNRGVLNQRKTDNYATIEETVTLPITAGLTANPFWYLPDTVRAQAIAKNFQYYRITSVVYRFKPNFDSYIAPGAPGAQPTLPYLYFAYDRSNTLPALSIPQFEQLGCKPIRMDDKIIVKRLKPAVIGEANGNLPAQYRISPWLPCNTDSTGAFQLSAVQHYGNAICITKTNVNDVQVYDVDVVLTIQFKSPAVYVSQSAPRYKPTITQGHVASNGEMQV